MPCFLLSRNVVECSSVGRLLISGRIQCPSFFNRLRDRRACPSSCQITLSGSLGVRDRLAGFCMLYAKLDSLIEKVWPQTILRLWGEFVRACQNALLLAKARMSCSKM